MNMKIISTAVLGLALVFGTAAGQPDRSLASTSPVNLYFDGATQVSPLDFKIACNTCCNLVAEYPAGTTDFAILAAPHDPLLPWEWSLLCVAPLPAGGSISMGGVIPPGFAGCCFAFLAVGANPKAVLVSDVKVLHIQ